MQLLKGHRAKIAAHCAQLGVVLDDDAFVFSLAPDNSKALLPRYVTQRYRRMAIRLKLRSTRLHAQRHYSATELLVAGVEQADRRAAETIADIMPTPQPTPKAPVAPM